MVIKRSGVTEPFSRTKVINGVRKACQGRPVTEDALAKLGQRVEEALRATGSAELTTHDVGLAILGPLQELDLVAYLRFASVYRAFESLEDFEGAIAELREARRRPADGETEPGEDASGERAREDDRGQVEQQAPVPVSTAD
jgi:transcriptional repressor NrdR